jgi:hypothetical protein
MNILGESKVLLSFMKPDSSERLNVFDMIWQEIIHASCSPLKGCLHAPYIMKMIEVVTQIRYEKGTIHLSYTPFWIDPNNPASRMKKAPVSSREQTSAGPIHPSSAHGTPTPRGCGRGHGLGARLAHGIAAFSPCVGIYLLLCMSWQGGGRRRMTISIITQSLWVILLLPARLMCLFMHHLLISMNGTNKHTVYHSCLLMMKKLMKNFLIIEISLSRLLTKVIRAPPLLILHPRIHLVTFLLLVTPGRKTLL